MRMANHGCAMVIDLALVFVCLIHQISLAEESSADGTPCGPKVLGMACVPSGEFLRGSNDGPKDERPAETIYLDAFFIDLYEVTYPDYQACVKAKACRSAHPNYQNFSGPKQPMVGVSWFGAEEFCRWKNKRLPTETEWEKAARGTDGRRYPWGNEPANCKRAIIKEKGVEVNGCGKGTTWPVGSRPSTQYGLYDMAGNSWEWVADWYSKSYSECGDACRGKNPKGPCLGAANCPGYAEKVVRGGSWFWEAPFATTSKRRSHFPENRPQFHHFGFRCAKDPQAGSNSPAPSNPNDGLGKPSAQILD